MGNIQTYKNVRDVYSSLSVHATTKINQVLGYTKILTILVVKLQNNHENMPIVNQIKG
jgi:hypothetical protein